MSKECSALICCEQKKIRLVKGLILLLLLSLAGCSHRYTLDKNVDAQIHQEQNYLHSYERQGVITQTDYARLIHIGAYTENEHKLSDADLLFSLHILTTPPLLDTPKNRSLRRGRALDSLIGRKQVTKKQGDLIVEKIGPIAADDKDPNQLPALYALASTTYADVVPLLETIQHNSSNKEVQQTITERLPLLRQRLAKKQ